MVLRSLAVWFALLVAAFINGSIRALMFVPALGDGAAHILSAILLSVLVLLISWIAITWMHPDTPAHALAIGALWLVLTVAFEFLAGHYLFGGSWEKLLGDYNVLKGRIWPLVLVCTAIAPIWTAHMRGLFITTPR